VPAELTAVQLVDIAARFELEASTRLITDWVSLGLIDRPTRRGLGRGKGVLAVWPAAQAELLVDLLILRQQFGVKHVALLANLPVLGWLDERPHVPLRQVRRALATWCGQHRRTRGVSRDTARRAASQLVKSLEHPHASAGDRAELRRVLEAAMRSQTFDRETFSDAVRRVFDPHGEHWAFGPREAPITTEAVVRITEARFAALNALEELSDREYEDARLIYVTTRTGYARDYPSFSSDAHRIGAFEEPTLSNVLNNACRDLLTILGMGRLAPARQTELAGEAQASTP
jgi:hypothetical protein